MSDTKLTVLLATALFLISAPEPDSATIAEMTANFVIPTNERALLASDLESQDIIATESVVTTREQQAQRDHEAIETAVEADLVGSG